MTCSEHKGPSILLFFHGFKKELPSGKDPEIPLYSSLQDKIEILMGMRGVVIEFPALLRFCSKQLGLHVDIFAKENICQFKQLL